MWAALATMVDRHPGRGRADRHPPDPVLHPGQPHRLHGVRHRPGDGGRAGRARSSTSSTTSPSRRRCSSSPGLIERQGGSTSVDRLGGLAKALAAAGDPVLRAGDEPGRHPAVLGVHRQARPAARRASPTAAGWRSSLVAGGVVTSLLTLVAVARVWSRAFWRPPTQAPADDTAAAAAATPEPEVATPRAGDGGRRRTPDDGQPTARQAGPAARRGRGTSASPTADDRRRRPDGRAAAVAGAAAAARRDGRRDGGDGRRDRRR